MKMVPFILPLAFAFTGCAEQPNVLASTEGPGTAVISYPNTYEKTWTTTLMSDPNVRVAGIDGRVLTIAVFNREKRTNELAVDLNGDLGVSGAILSRSSRRDKKDIQPYRQDALGLLRRVQIVAYRYKNEANSTPLHIGFIAEDAPHEFTGPHRQSFNLNNSLAITMAANKELSFEIDSMQREIDQMQREINALRQRH